MESSLTASAVTSSAQQAAGRRAAISLALSILVFGANWPIIKIATLSIGPLWFNELRMIAATVLFTLTVVFRGRFILPSRQDLPIIAGLGLLQSGVVGMAASYGVSVVGAGRAAILIYTNSIWITIGATVFLGERISRAQAIGMVVGLVGIATLFNPFAFDWSDRRVVWGNLVVIAGSMFWAVSLLQMRGHRWRADPLQVMPYATFIGALISLPFAMTVEAPWPTISWSWEFGLAVALATIFATCLGFWWVITAARDLPSIALSLGQMSTPVVGVVASVILIGEEPSLSDVLGLILIVGGVALAAIFGRTRFAKRTPA